MSASQESKLIQPSLGTSFRRRARVYLMTGIIGGVVVLVTALTLVVLNSGEGRPTRAADTSTDTGAAKVTSVTITQAGTGASVTIGGETTTPTGEVLDETQYGNNATRRKILNNNVAVYKVNYNVTQAGRVTLKFKLPANTPIDRSSIASCADESKLSTASSVNPWNGETEQSYAYNVAECVINADSAGAGEWVVKANLWGGNGEKIAPTIAVNDVSQNVQIEPITILARADYYASVTSYLAKQSPSGGRNNESSLSIILSSPITNSDVAGLGIEPLESGLKLQLSTNLPASSTVGWLQIRGAGCDPLTKGAGVRDCTMVAGVHNGSITANMGSDGVITYQVGGVVSGAHWCPKEWTSSCVVVQTSSIVGVLTSELTSTEKQFEAKFVDATYKTRSGGETTIKGRSTRKWTLRNRSYGNPVAWFSPPQVWSGVDGLESYQDRRPVYRGEEISRGAWVQMNTTVDSDHTNNFYYCQSFNPSLVRITGEFAVGSSRVAGNFNVYGDGKVGAQYGVITAPSNVTPNSNKAICGQYGKGDVKNEDVEPMYLGFSIN